MKNKKIIIGIIVVSIIVTLLFVNKILLINKKNRDEQEIAQNDIKNNKDVIYGLFDNFPDSDNIYYTSKNLYSKRSIGPTIYQLDILAELTDEGYNNFIKHVEFCNLDNFEMRINPNKINYNWKAIKNIEIIKSKDVEDASINNIYLDESQKAIYIIAKGGN